MHSLNCPNCGAPFSDQTDKALWLCIYCNSLSRVDTGGAPALERTLPEGEMAHVKQLLADGKRVEAVSLYTQVAGVPSDEAEAALETMAREFSMKVIRGQQLNGVGMILIVLFTIALPASLIGWYVGSLNPVVALLVGGYSALNLFFFIPSLRATLKYRNALKASAEVLHFTPIGGANLQGRGVQVFKTLVEVRPVSGQPFREAFLLPVREKNLGRMHTGSVLKIKYLPGEAGSIIYDGMGE